MVGLGCERVVLTPNEPARPNLSSLAQWLSLASTVIWGLGICACERGAPERGKNAAGVSQATAVFPAPQGAAPARVSKGELESQWRALASSLPDRLSQADEALATVSGRSQSCHATNRDAIRAAHADWLKARAAFSAANVREAVELGIRAQKEIDGANLDLSAAGSARSQRSLTTTRQ